MPDLTAGRDEADPPLFTQMMQQGSVAAGAIHAMKKWAGVSTDSELAEFIGLTQSAVAQWRRRNSIPEAVELKFSQAMKREEPVKMRRAVMARALAMRLAEYQCKKIEEKGAFLDRKMVYSICSEKLDSTTDECYHQLSILEDEFQISSDKAASLLIENATFYERLSEWCATLSPSEVLRRQAQSLTPPMGQGRSNHIDFKVPQSGSAMEDEGD